MLNSAGFLHSREISLHYAHICAPTTSGSSYFSLLVGFSIYTYLWRSTFSRKIRSRPQSVASNAITGLNLGLAVVFRAQRSCSPSAIVETAPAQQAYHGVQQALHNSVVVYKLKESATSKLVGGRTLYAHASEVTTSPTGKIYQTGVVSYLLAKHPQQCLAVEVSYYKAIFLGHHRFPSRVRSAPG